jgi:indolepyruvate ferredoxin oxidoreductase alpha subunit
LVSDHVQEAIRLLSGNEAIARGAYEAGVKVAAAYPGTPSTEILEYLAEYSGVHAEWAPNEKVAVEVALGASMAGARALAAMKHVGVNVAADALLTASYTGVTAGLVLVSADDPGMHSSQNEQDNRHYARAAKVPMLEPTDSQEAHDLMVRAFDISERFDTPVLFRTTTRIAHSKTPCTLGTRTEHGKPIEHQRAKYVMVPGNAKVRHKLVEERMLALKKFSDEMNQVEWRGRDVGIIADGVAYQYAREVFPDASVLKLVMSHPLPEARIRELAAGVKALYVIEELDPFIEEQVRAMGIACVGKAKIPLMGELSPEVVAKALLGVDKARKVEGLPELPPRPPSVRTNRMRGWPMASKSPNRG